MKCLIPEIAWHNRDPVLSVDFQPSQNQKGFVRLATGGCDTHVVLWYVKTDETGSVNIEVAADLFHHQKAINVVRWSPSGELLASGDDESAIIIWKQKTDVDPPPLFEANDEQDKETWNVYKMLRGHVEDVYDLSWCPQSMFIISGSVDNTAIVWNVHKGKSMGMLHHKGFVQGVSWDPNNQYAVTMSSDRLFRAFDVNTKKVVARSSKSVLPLPVLHPHRGQSVRLFHDDTLQSFFRRLEFSPDGELIAVPTGLIEGEQSRGLKNMNATYIYSRYSLQTPICILPCGESPSLAVRWSPIKYTARKDGPPPLINLPSAARMILAVGTNDSISVYDTQQNTPLAIVLNPQYARLTDMTWSNDGHILIVSSTDGYCSIITFSMDELGQILCEEAKCELTKPTNIKLKANGEATPMDVDTEENKNISETNVKNKSIVFNEENKSKNNEESHKTPNKNEKVSTEKKSTPKYKSPKPKTSSTKKKGKAETVTEVKPIVMDETAMEAWSQDGFPTKAKDVSPDKPKCQIVIDDLTEDMKLVYEDTQDLDKSGKKDDKDKLDINIEKEKSENKIEKTKVESVVQVQSALPKTGRRVNFITLSSPKNKKKLT